MLNVIVRAHGQLTWCVERNVGVDKAIRTILGLSNGTWGWSLIVPPGGVPQPVAVDRRMPTETADTRPEILDRIVGTVGPEPLRVIGGFSEGAAKDLSRAVGVPFGFEDLPSNELTVSFQEPVSLTGVSLRQALDFLSAADPRYEWREIEGMIVVSSGDGVVGSGQCPVPARAGRAAGRCANVPDHGGARRILWWRSSEAPVSRQP